MPNIWADLDNTVEKIINERKRNLLIMYYSTDYGRIDIRDKKILYSEFRDKELTPDDAEIKLDIILHTYGGDPNAAYLLAQLIRDFSIDINILIPEIAASAGTLFSFCADKVIFGHLACLSPIDISYGLANEGEGTELVNIDYYLQFVRHCRSQIESTFLELEKEHEEFTLKELTTKIEEPLLLELAQQENCLDIGKYFRERNITGFYSAILLENYLLSKFHKKHLEELRGSIISNLLYECPSHDFRIDYHMAKKLGFPEEVIEIMNTGIYDLTTKVINNLVDLELSNEICEYHGNDYKIPYFRLYVI